MKTLAAISIYREDQPSAETWEALERFGEAWNAGRNQPDIRAIAGLFLRVVPTDITEPGYQRILGELGALERDRGAVWVETYDDVADPEDFEAADFIWILGVRVDGGDERDFAQNDPSGPRLRCSACDSAGPWRATQIEDYVVDESMLDGPAANGDTQLPPVAGGWDLVNLPAGLALSRRALGVLERAVPSGWTTRPLRSAATGEVSTRVRQLVAAVSLPAACAEHDPGSRVCPECGVVRDGALRGVHRMRRADVGDLLLWSNDVERTGGIHVAQSVYRALVGAGLQGLTAMTPSQLCDHPPPGSSAP